MTKDADQVEKMVDTPSFSDYKSVSEKEKGNSSLGDDLDDFMSDSSGLGGPLPLSGICLINQELNTLISPKYDV